jgi:hypothetical protein
MSIYTEAGYVSRNDYLMCLAEDYGIQAGIVIGIADLLGPSEDFDGLISALEDYSNIYC